MNILIYALIILVVSYILLRLIASASAKKISKTVRFVIFIISILLALLFAFGGRFLFSLPLILLSLGVIKLKGLTLYQLIGLYRLIQTLRNSGRFSFNKNNSNLSTLSVEEAYKIINSKIINNEDDLEISVGRFERGLYFISIQSGEKTNNLKFLVK